MAHTRRADADSRPATSSLSRRKMRILRRRKGRPAFSKRKGGAIILLNFLHLPDSQLENISHRVRIGKNSLICPQGKERWLKKWVPGHRYEQNTQILIMHSLKTHLLSLIQGVFLAPFVPRLIPYIFFSPGRVDASKVRDAGSGIPRSRPQGQIRRVARKGKALVETGLSIGRKLKSGASRQGARLKSVVRKLRNKRR